MRNDAAMLAPLQWPAEAIWQAVAPHVPGFNVEIRPTLDSTNAELLRRARAARYDPILLVAEHQVAGRGRMGRTWHSAGRDAAGDMVAALTFSLGLSLQLADWSGLALAVGLALADNLHPEVRLKWPNDLYWQARKLGGVLIETVPMGLQRYAVIGVGINLALPHNVPLHTPAAALAEVMGQADAPQVLGQIVYPLVRAVLKFAQEGFQPLQARFQARDFLFAREVTCSNGVHGVAHGVDARGALLVHTPTGLQKIWGSEVSVRVPDMQTAHSF